jgi:hypothetical protein
LLGVARLGDTLGVHGPAHYDDESDLALRTLDAKSDSHAQIMTGAFAGCATASPALGAPCA